LQIAHLDRAFFPYSASTHPADLLALPLQPKISLWYKSCEEAERYYECWEGLEGLFRITEITDEDRRNLK